MTIAPSTPRSRLPIQTQQGLSAATLSIQSTKPTDRVAHILEVLTLAAAATQQLGQPTPVRSILASLGITQQQIATQQRDPVIENALQAVIDCWAECSVSDRAAISPRLSDVPVACWLMAFASRCQSSGHTSDQSSVVDSTLAAITFATCLDVSQAWTFVGSHVGWPHPRIAQHSAEAIERRVGACTDSDHPISRCLDALVMQLLKAWNQHKQSPIVHASLIFAGLRDDTPLALVDDTAPYAHEIRVRLRRSRHAHTYLLALRWLTHPSIGAAALDRLAHPPAYQSEASALCGLLENSWLMLHPARARRLHMLDVTDTLTRTLIDTACAGTDTHAGQLSENAKIGLCRWLNLTEAPEHTRALVAQQFATDDSRSVRIANVQQASLHTLQDTLYDQSSDVALGSALRLFWSEKFDQQHKARSRVAKHSFDRLAQHADARMKLFAKSVQAHSVPSHIHTHSTANTELLDVVQTQLRTSHAIDKVAAINLARRLKLIDKLVPELVMIASSDTRPHTGSSLETQAIARAQAGAVSSLGLASDPSTVESAITQCLHSTDHRVRANAIEAFFTLAQRTTGDSGVRGRCYASMIEHKADAHQRVRANAIRSLLLYDSIGASAASQGSLSYDTTGLKALGAMLGDPREDHQISSLWILRRLAMGGHWQSLGSAWATLMAQVGEIARKAQSDHVQRRAELTHTTMRRALREAWSRTTSSSSIGSKIDSPLHVGTHTIELA